MISPLDLRGPEFLSLYAWLLVGSVVAGLVIRRLLRAGGTPGSGVPPRLDAFETAYLREGPPAAFDVALIKLMEEGTLERGPTPHLLRGARESSRATNEIERALINAARHPCAIHHARAACEVPIARAGNKLIALGLVASSGSGAVARFLSALPLLATLLLGVAKIFVGISRGRPVGFLVLSTIFCLFVLSLFAKWRPGHRTRAGDSLFMKLKKATERVHPVASGRGEADSYAMHGRTALLASTAMMVSGFLYVPPPPIARRPDTGGCGSSCGGSCGSSCGGGGGCGGCGGS